MNRQSPNNNRRVRWRHLLIWKNALNHDYKNNSGRNFPFTKFSFSDFVLTDKRSLSGKRPKSASGKSFSCRFSFPATRNANTKATEYVTFGFSFRVLVFSPFRKVWTALSVSDTDFFSVIAAIIRESSDKLPCIENREGFAAHSSTWPSGAKGEWRISSWLAISTHVEKIRYFSTYVVTAFLRAGNPCIAPQFMW